MTPETERQFNARVEDEAEGVWLEKFAPDEDWRKLNVLETRRMRESFVDGWIACAKRHMRTEGPDAE